MPQTEADLEKLDEIATEISARFRKGEHPAIAEYVAQYPILAVELRALFPTIAAMERLKVNKEFRSGSRASLRGLQLTRLGDFRIIREIGRGGMGIVYEAEQESLGRRVAVKVLPRHVLLAPEHLHRFQREAQIAGRLHHTNIVSVFGVGEHDGFHYYVMPFIPGVGLDRVITRLAESGAKAKAAPYADTKAAADTAVSGVEKLPELDDVVRHLFSESKLVHHGVTEFTEKKRNIEGQKSSSVPPPSAEFLPTSQPFAPSGLPLRELRDSVVKHQEHWSRIARIGWQVANALDFAHQQGTLHCDIKPANLLVDPQGTVWVTDFGVAKAMQTDKLTRTGDVTGTLHYTAPERFQGQTDGRSDVYSLGLTLYELLALRPAFAEGDRQALMRQILDGTPTPLRQLVPHIPRDLETIVLKAIARDPNHRYATAGALADDLQRYLEDRPILARRATYSERLTRWCRKNPAVASLLGTVACLLIVVAFLITRGYFNSRELQQAESVQRHKAEATTRVALDVLDRIYAQFAPHGASDATELALDGTDQTEIAIPVQPAISPETAAVLENLLTFYDRLAIDGGDNQELRQEAAKANRRVADIQAHLGQREKAAAAYQRSLRMYQQLAGESTDKNRYVAEIAGIHNELGGLDRLTAKNADAKTAHREALRLLEPLATQASASPEARFELARTYYSLGTANRGSNIPLGGDLLGIPDHPLGPGGPGGTGGPFDGPGRREPPGARGPLGPPPEDGSRPFGPDGPRPKPGFPPGGPGEFGGPPPFGGPPDKGFGPPPQHDMRPGAKGPEDGGDAREEDAYLLKAIALLEPLCQERPNEADYRHLLACCYRDLARSPSPPPEAVDGFEKAATILNQLVKDFPHVPVYRFDLIATQARLGVREFKSPLAEREIEQSLRRALQSAEDLVAEYPDVPAYAAFQVPMLHKLSGLLIRAGRWDDAQTELNKAIKIQTDLVARFPGLPSHQLWLAIVQRSLAEAFRGQGKLKDARAQLENAVKTLTIWPQSAAPPPQADALIGDTYHRLSMLLGQLGEKQLSGDAARKAEEFGPPR